MIVNPFGVAAYIKLINFRVIDGFGNAFISGYTWGSLGPGDNGGIDAFLVKLSPAPEPGTLILTLIITIS